MPSSRRSAAATSLATLDAGSFATCKGPATFAVRPTARADIIFQTDPRGGSGDRGGQSATFAGAGASSSKAFRGGQSFDRAHSRMFSEPALTGRVRTFGTMSATGTAMRNLVRYRRIADLTNVRSLDLWVHGLDLDPSHAAFSFRARTQRSTTARAGPFLLCMGLFSQFCVLAQNCED